MAERSRPSRTAAPWYRHPLVWLLVAIPASSVLMGAVMITLAIATDDGLVDDDYYQRGLQINRSLARDAFAKRAGIEAVVRRSGGGLRLELRSEPGFAFPSTLTLRAMRATRGDADRTIVLTHLGDGRYASDRAWPETGLWNLELGTERWRLTVHHATGPVVRFGA